MAMGPPVEGDGVPRQEAAHARRQRHGAGAEEQRNMIRQPRPRRTRGRGEGEDVRETGHERRPVGVLPTHGPALDPTADQVAPHSGRSHARVPWPAPSVRPLGERKMLSYYYGRLLPCVPGPSKRGWRGMAGIFPWTSRRGQYQTYVPFSYPPASMSIQPRST